MLDPGSEHPQRMWCVRDMQCDMNRYLGAIFQKGTSTATCHTNRQRAPLQAASDEHLRAIVE